MEKAKMSQRFSAVFAPTVLQMYGMITPRAINTTCREEKYCGCRTSCFSSAALIRFPLLQLLVLYYFHSFYGSSSNSCNQPHKLEGNKSSTVKKKKKSEFCFWDSSTQNTIIIHSCYAYYYANFTHLLSVHLNISYVVMIK